MIKPKPEQKMTVNKMSAFFCPAESVHLKARETRSVSLHFLPFNVGESSSPGRQEIAE